MTRIQWKAHISTFLKYVLPSTTHASDEMFTLSLKKCQGSGSGGWITRRGVWTSGAKYLSPGPGDWRPEIFVGAVSTVAAQFNSSLDWRLVTKSLDIDSSFSSLTRPSLTAIAKSFHTTACRNLLLIQCSVDTWLHLVSQLCVLQKELGLLFQADWNMLNYFDGTTVKIVLFFFFRVSLVKKVGELNAVELL